MQPLGNLSPTSWLIAATSRAFATVAHARASPFALFASFFSAFFFFRAAGDSSAPLISAMAMLPAAFRHIFTYLVLL